MSSATCEAEAFREGNEPNVRWGWQCLPCDIEQYVPTLAEAEAAAIAHNGRATGMTVASLMERLARMPGHAEVVVNASNRDGDEIFALVKNVDLEPTCEGPNVCRLYADQDDDDPVA